MKKYAEVLKFVKKAYPYQAGSYAAVQPAPATTAQPAPATPAKKPAGGMINGVPASQYFKKRTNYIYNSGPGGYTAAARRATAVPRGGWNMNRSTGRGTVPSFTLQ